MEHAAQEIAEATSKPPFLYDLGPQGARQVLDDIQAAPVPKLDVDEKWITVPASVGDVQVRIVKPVGAVGPLPTILYVHGGGWVLGNAGTYDRLVRELAVGVNAAVVFVEYDRSPEARYPVAIEQAYSTAQWITRAGLERGPRQVSPRRGRGLCRRQHDRSARDSCQAARRRHLRASVPVLPGDRRGAGHRQYREFAEGPFLRAKSMAWFWDAYCPDLAKRSEITASPLRASIDDLRGLPEAFLIVDENDVLRDEGEAYARKLTEAGVRATVSRGSGGLGLTNRAELPARAEGSVVL